MDRITKAMIAKHKTLDPPDPWATARAINEGFGMLSDASYCIRQGIKAADPQTHEAKVNLCLMEELAERLEALEKEYRATWSEITEGLPEEEEDGKD